LYFGGGNVTFVKVIRRGLVNWRNWVNVDTEVNRGLKTILFVDDEMEARRTFSEVLSDMGYNVIDKSDGLSALSLIRQGVPVDLVITDYRMPDMNGLDLVKTLRKILPSIPVIMMTAHGDIENYFRSLSLGVFEYVNKPIGKREFEQLVKAALHETEAA
jgi:two-component system, NtrC family, response regulator AtoC